MCAHTYWLSNICDQSIIEESPQETPFFFFTKMIEGPQEIWSTISLKDSHMFEIAEL